MKYECVCVVVVVRSMCVFVAGLVIIDKYFSTFHTGSDAYLFCSLIINCTCLARRCSVRMRSISCKELIDVVQVCK